ncbi:helix-turn-helix domain-containing protein [Haloarcula salinisoli]|uniref:Winged helix-turn-helix domain-containing protein n=1 Tax=Haloarcula salinisoli TaxID=2487746 RepID=A0A8J7YEY4_9EURY|nr:winged helix-turn-helix domain-containing protein [Halomicroarcula salinisoli]MBX0287716.1 winged helix-turn-helix domain-containing protein [Halomicroarcula salinisoli]MBX0304640.1 winged helix-turn-helix domain-containing protein [Halomicroarcula salinisoli]
MSADPDIETLAGLLEDETVRVILTETSDQPMSASTLEQRCDVSGPTIYRRLERLQACDLVVEQTRPDPDGGHHRKLYAANLERVTVDLVDGQFELTIDRHADMADRFTRLIEGI